MLALAGCGGGSSGNTPTAQQTAAPTITTEPVNVTVIEGQPAVFSVVASGGDTLAYQWQRDGATIAGAIAFSYTLPATASTDEGSAFTVLVSNSAGSVTSAPATLVVTPLAPSAPATPTGSSYVLAERESDGIVGPSGRVETYATSVQIFDPAVPGPVQSVDFGISTNPGAAFPWTTQSYTIDRDARTLDYNGKAMMYYVDGGKIYKVDLLTTASHAPSQVSSVANACAVSPPFVLDAAGTKAWLSVSVMVGGVCSRYADNQLHPSGQTFVRTDMSATTAPVTLGGVATMYAVLDDGAKNALGLLMQVNNAWQFRSAADLSLISAVVNPPTSPDLLAIGYDYAALQAGYYRSGNVLVRLSWTASTATFEVPSYTFTSAFNSQLTNINATEASAVYFGDATKLMKVSGLAAPVLIATASDVPIYWIAPTSTHVVALQADASVSAPTSIMVLPKNGDSGTMLAGGILLGVAENKMVYQLATGATHVYNLDGTGDTETTMKLPGAIYQRSQRYGQFHLDSLFACEPVVADDTDCNNGGLVQTDLALTTRTVLGSISHASSSTKGSLAQGNRLSNSPMTAGLPALLTFHTLSGKLPQQLNDFYSIKPGTAGSLLRLTSKIP